MPRLNAQPNVTIVGYVRATYCKRSLDDVFEDIETYAERSLESGLKGLEVQGIFVDETVNLHSEEAKRYLDQIDRKVKETMGIGGDRLVSVGPACGI